MSDEANVASNATSEPVQPVAAEPVASAPEAAPVETEQAQPAKSAREALERSFAKLEMPETVEGKPDKNRDPLTGKFAPKEKIAEPAKVETVAVQQPQVSAVEPPTRFTKEAQAEFAKAHPIVQQETLRAINELTQGIEKYREGAELFEPLRQYHEAAKQYGVKMEDAMANYVALDHMWGTNPVKGFLETCRKCRVDPQELINAVVSGGQLQSQGPDPRDTLIHDLRRELVAIREEVGGVKQTFQQTQKNAEAQALTQQVDAFKKEHPYFDELEPTMVEMVETGFVKNRDLKVLYEKALRLNPEIAAKVEADKAARQPRQQASNAKAALSISGAPQGGSNPTAKPAGSPREALTRSFASLGLR